MLIVIASPESEVESQPPRREPARNADMENVLEAFSMARPSPREKGRVDRVVSIDHFLWLGLRE